MSTCLYCGAELNSTTAHFCRGHHRPYRINLIAEWNVTSDAFAREDIARKLRRFQGWWDYDNNCPVPMANASTRTRSTRQAAPVVRRARTPITGAFRKFGIELETSSESAAILDGAVSLANASGVDIRDMHRYTHEHTPYWHITTDSSISGPYGREIVSPAFDTEAGYDQVYTLCNILNTMGVKVNDSCGYHVHLDVSDLTAKQFARIVKFYQVYETEIDKLHQRSRRGNNRHWCKSLEGFRFNPENVSSIRDLASSVFHGDRYLKVNTQAYLAHGTIEFRQHGATIDPLKIVYWIKFCARVVEYAKTDNEISASTPLFEALNLSEAEKIYWKRRIEVLAA